MEKTRPNLSKYLWAWLLLVAFIFSATRGASAQYIDEATLELELASRLESMLEKVIGKDRSLVKVDVTISRPDIEPLSSFQRSPVKDMPGIIVPEAPASSEESRPKSLVPTIQKISVLVYVDQALPKEKITQIYQEIPRWIDLDFARGDSLEIKPIPWKPLPPEDIALTQLAFLRSNFWLVLILSVMAVLLMVFSLPSGVRLRRYIFQRLNQRRGKALSPEEESRSHSEQLLEEIRVILSRSAQASPARVTALLEDIREGLSKSPSRMDALLEDIKGSLERIAALQASKTGEGGAGGGGGGGGGGGPGDFLAALRETVAPMFQAPGEGGGPGMGPEVLTALGKIEELLRIEVTSHGPESDILDEPFKYLNTLSREEIGLVIENESAHIAAVVLAHIDAHKSSEVLIGLPPERQVEITNALATLVETDEVAEEMKEFLQRKMKFIKLHADFNPVAGERALADILSISNYETTTKILGMLEQRDPKAASRVKKLMFLFEDIANLDDRTVQEILKSLDRDRLALALSGTSDQVRERVYVNMTERAREMLKEDVAALSIPKGTEPLSSKIHFFEDIVELDTKTAQDIFRSIDKDTLKVALKGASEAVRQKIYSMMTERGAAMLREDIEVMPSIDRERVEEAQEKILEQIRRYETKALVAQQGIIETIRKLERMGRINLGKVEGEPLT